MIQQAHPDRETWLASRRHFIGASESPQLVGCGFQGQDAWSLYDRKVHGEPDADGPMPERLECGLALQPAILDLFTRRTGLEVVDPGEYTVRLSEERPHVGTTLDGLTEDDDGRAIVEVKNVDGMFAGDWSDDEPPLRVAVQVQHQMYATGIDHAYVAALIGGNRLVTKRLERHERFLAMLLPVVDAFWEHVQQRVPPPVDETQACREALARIYAEDNGATVALPAEAVEWDRELQEAKAAIKAAEETRRGIENRIKAAIGENTFGEIPGGGRYKWATTERHDPPREAKTITYRQLRRLKK
jgi:predicted phage-related endonuclease